MNIKDNFGKEKKEENIKRINYMTDIEDHHNRQNTTSFSGDRYSKERSVYVDEYGNAKRYVMASFLQESIKAYLRSGNIIDNHDFSITIEGEMLVYNNKFYKLKHSIITP